MANAKKYYAYFVPDTKAHGVTNSWSECERFVRGRANARFRGFKTREEAEDWLHTGAHYEKKPVKKLEKGIYFDAGTGRGQGVEISVTDEKGTDLLHLVLPKSKVNKFGKHRLPLSATNNFGELLACAYALRLALERGEQKVFGDSALILNFWSKGHVKSDMPAKTKKVAEEAALLRREFEEKGGVLSFVSGDHNPADLGFH